MSQAATRLGTANAVGKILSIDETHPTDAYQADINPSSLKGKVAPFFRLVEFRAQFSDRSASTRMNTCASWVLSIIVARNGTAHQGSFYLAGNLCLAHVRVKSRG
jgi:hypothetical protein